MYINSRDQWPLMLIVREMVAESGTSMVHQSATAIEDLAQPFTLQMAIIIFHDHPYPVRVSFRAEVFHERDAHGLCKRLSPPVYSSGINSAPGSAEIIETEMKESEDVP